MQAIAAGVPASLEEVHSDTRNVLLTLARVWTTMATGVALSKDHAADWALARLPAHHRPAMALARDAYLGKATDYWDERHEHVFAVRQYMREQINRLQAGQR